MGFLVSALAPTAAVLPFAGTSSPDGWLLCDGRAISREMYSGLFAAIGTAYGSGDGSTTFNLPDYRWTFLRGCGSNISVTGSGTAASNQATFTAHGFNRTGVRVRLSSGGLSGLAGSTNYWVIVVDANTLAFATSKANARSNTRIGISGANSAVIVQWEDPDISSREANAPGANSTANIGAYQDHTFMSHGHSTTAGPSMGNLGSGSNWGSPNYGGTTGSSGGNETRPSNISINYIIKI
jgi:microcystin-dependent protein